MSERTGSLRVLAFEPYDAGSHRAVRESITRHSRHRWTWVTRPGHAWKWRMRLAALEMTQEAETRGLLGRDAIDVLFATSLMSTADLRAALPAGHRDRPLVLYVHENQVVYPAGEVDDERDVHFGLTNLASMLTADRVVFNSDWNRRSFIDGIMKLLRHAPDATLRDVGPRLDRISTVIWPPVEPPAPAGRAAGERHRGAPIRVVWPHRWEHDKGPDELLDIAERCTRSLDIRWTILGQRFREVPPALRAFQTRFTDAIDHFGFEPDRTRYLERVSRCDWVLSTARHEFFGIAVVEAMLAGCLPWLPDRLSYPELLPVGGAGLSPATPPEDPGAIRAAIERHLRPAVAPVAVGRIDDLIDRVAGDRRASAPASSA